jgi:NAD(P)-dependent dehydrogenase (short-subunit alcohol dehydrogenase family)
MSELFDVSGRVVIITGGGGLLGRAYAEHLCSAGARVVLADIDGLAASRAAEALDAQSVLALPTDVGDVGSVGRMVERTLSVFGAVDALVNNAALDPKFDRVHAGGHCEDFESYPLARWEAALRVNLTGAFLCAQAVAGPMRKRGRGVVINVSSIYGLVGPDQSLYAPPRPGQPPRFKPVDYSVTKSALLGFTRYLAAYWAGTGLRVNTLTLGGVFNHHEETFAERYARRTPLGRMARHNEYCGALQFLISDASSYMTGSNLVVDGGWTAW